MLFIARTLAQDDSPLACRALTYEAKERHYMTALNQRNKRLKAESTEDAQAVGSEGCTREPQFVPHANLR
jgi:hypothetical protein